MMRAGGALKPAVQWSITAVLFVAMFIGARIYLQRSLEEAQAPESGTPQVIPPGPPRPKAEPPAPPEPIDLAALRLGADAAGIDRSMAHKELTEIRESSIGSTQRTLELLAALPAIQADLEAAGHRDVAAHVLGLRVDLANGVGDDASALQAQFDAWKAKEPAAFAWMPEELPTLDEMPAAGQEPSNPE